MNAAGLDLPALAPVAARTLAPTPSVRRPCRQIMVGSVPVGGTAPISVQTMTTTPTTDVDATLQQIAAATAAGCDIIRVAVPSADDAAALPAIVAKSPIPVSFAVFVVLVLFGALLISADIFNPVSIG